MTQKELDELRHGEQNAPTTEYKVVLKDYQVNLIKEEWIKQYAKYNIGPEGFTVESMIVALVKAEACRIVIKNN